MRILYLSLEHPTWEGTRPWSYASGLGLEHGFQAAGIDHLTLTTPWRERARDISAGQQFDQVWVESAHQAAHDDAWWEWVASVAPVRLGLLPESLSDTTASVGSRLPYLTHVAAVDEHDSTRLRADGHAAVWWPHAVPRAFVRDTIDMPPNSFAYISGAELLQHPAVRGLLAPLPSPEMGTIHPGLHESLHLAVSLFLQRGLKDARRSLPEYLHLLRRNRSQAFRYWIEGLRTGCAVVNPSHVVEAMAAGRPVIASPTHSQGLFEDERDILLFADRDVEHLSTQIQRVLLDPGIGRRIAEAAQRKVLAHHTVEHRVRQLLTWIESGEEPTYA
jgi:hypothetical protein